LRNKDLNDLQTGIGYSFKDMSLLEEAFTHVSAESAAGNNYERLEFLGDAFINLVIADYLFGVYPDYSEGELTRMKAGVVSGKTLAELSKRLKLPGYISIGKGLAKQGIPDSVCSDVVESLCAAVFLDAGVRFAREFTISIFERELNQASRMTKDSKSRLQELVQKLTNECPKYEIVDISGVDHDKVFSATVTVRGILFGPCEGRTKKQSEQNAALLALKALTK
jgi:ribonuclease-3